MGRTSPARGSARGPHTSRPASSPSAASARRISTPSEPRARSSTPRPAPAGAHSYSEHTLPADTNSSEAGNIRLRVVGGFLFTALDPRRTAVSCFLKLDVVHPLVPPMLIDIFMKNFASMFLIALDKQATKHDAGGSLHHMLSAPENAPVYAELHRRLSRATGTSSQDSKEVARQLSAELTAARESQQLGTAKRL